ncbi:MAG: hypothetical protein CMK07_09770 [Ponticaulis sp.]|nr:hypothetical protein [Ponticaulis sp.]
MMQICARNWLLPTLAGLALSGSLPMTAEEAYESHIPHGFYVEEAETGEVDCSRASNPNWFYIGSGLALMELQPTGLPESRHFALGMGEDIRDFIATDVTAFDPATLDARIAEKMLDVFDGKLNGMMRGAGVYRGGLGATTGGTFYLDFGQEFKTGHIHLQRVEFSDGGIRDRLVVDQPKSEDNPNPNGLWPDGTQTRAFHYCPSG